MVTGAWLASGLLALRGAPISGHLGQRGLDLLLRYHFLGTCCVLGAVQGFSNLNVTVIILQSHLAEGGLRQTDACRAPCWVQ